MSFLHLARIHQLKEEAAGSLREVEGNSDADESSTDDYYDDAVNSDDGDSYQYQASDLPTQFLGTRIRRLIISQGQRLPPLHTNTSTNNATENNSNEATTQTHTASNIRDDDAVIATDDHSSNNAGQLSPWKHSRAKQRVINDLKDSSNDIHLHIGSYGPKNWENVKFRPLWEKYAKCYKLSNFTSNLKGWISIRWLLSWWPVSSNMITRTAILLLMFAS